MDDWEEFKTLLSLGFGGLDLELLKNSEICKSKRWLEAQTVESMGSAMVSLQVVLIGSLLFGSMPPPVWAAPNQETPFQVAQRHPPDRGTPPTRQGTGTRGDCGQPAGLPPLTALVGSDRPETVSIRPVFWVYIPYRPKEIASAEFSLQDGENDVLRASLTLPASTPGVVGISLPETVKPLQVGKSYRWYVEVMCSNQRKLSSPPSVTGLVKRVEPPASFKTELQQVGRSGDRAGVIISRTLVLSKYGFEFDVLNELAQYRINDPQSSVVSGKWGELLYDVGLESVAKDAIAGIITPQE